MGSSSLSSRVMIDTPEIGARKHARTPKTRYGAREDQLRESRIPHLLPACGIAALPRTQHRRQTWRGATTAGWSSPQVGFLLQLIRYLAFPTMVATTLFGERWE